jgi:ABC-type transport system substrate-binding protein
VHVADAAAVLQDAKRGAFDVIPALIPVHAKTQPQTPSMLAAFAPLPLAPPRMRYLAFNAQRAPLDDARVRHALALLVDRSAIQSRVFDGLARPALWPIWPGGLACGPEAPVPNFDPAAAAKLLDDAGWSDTNKDGVRDKGGNQLHLVMVGPERPPPEPMTSAGPAPKSERDYFVEAAKRIGVVIDVRTGGSEWLGKKLADGGYDLAEQAVGGMADMDLAPLVGHASPRVDRALDALAAAWDPAERAKLAPELAAALGEAWPLAGIVAEAPRGLVHRRVQGVKIWDGWIDLSQLSFAPEAP